MGGNKKKRIREESIKKDGCGLVLLADVRAQAHTWNLIGPVGGGWAANVRA